MSDPKHPVDPLAETHAALPQSTVATAHPYAAPQPGAPTYAQQLAAHQAAQAPQHGPPPAKRSAALWVIAAVVVTGAAAGIAFAITKLSSSSESARKPPVVATRGSQDGVGINPLLADAGGAPSTNGNGAGSSRGAGSSAGAGSANGPAGSELVLDVLAQRHVTLDPGIARELAGKRLAADAFVIGVDASEVGSGPDAAATFVAHDFEGATRAGGGSSQMAMRLIGGKTMQYASASIDAMVNGTLRTYLVTEVHASQNGVDVIRAWLWSRAVPDQLAYDASKHGALPDPARIDDVHGDAALEAKVRAALNSRATYIAMLDDDGFSFGSAGETLKGPRVKAGFRAMTAEFKLHDGLRVVTVQPGFAYAAANVDFSNRYGTETFRVLLALGNDNGTWKILQGHWSNGFPIPGAP